MEIECRVFLQSKILKYNIVSGWESINILKNHRFLNYIPGPVEGAHLNHG